MPGMDYIRLLFVMPYVRAILGALAVAGFVALVIAIYPNVNRETVATIGAFSVAALIVIAIY